ncbi:MAG: hypothetical protein ACOYVF_01245 [Candidatus Zixiibacteriota bacterium]
MFGFTDISVDFLTGQLFFVWLTLVVLLVLAFWLYYRTNPPVSPLWRVLFILLRVVAVLALTAALFEPVVNYSREYERRRKVAVLLDKSSSMNRVERDKTRAERLDSLIGSETFARLENMVDRTTFYFGGNLTDDRKLVDSEKTALGDALYEMKKLDLAQPADYWLIFSDGKSNSGREPGDIIRGVDVPVGCVGMAVDVGNFDVGLTAVDFNPVVFVGQATEIKVKLTWHNAAGKKLKVRLMDSTRVAAETGFDIEQESGYGDIVLKYLPDKPGQKLLQVSIPAFEGEESAGNNQRTVAVKILKNRLLVLQVARRPDYEVGFLKRFLMQSDKYDVELIVTGDKAGNLAGRFPDRQTDLNRYDLVILHDPDPVQLERRKDIIRSYLNEKGGAIWVLMGEAFASRGPVSWFNELLPFYQSRRQPLEALSFHGEPSESDLFHPAIRLADERNAIREIWANLPPFTELVRCDRIDEPGVVLAYASGTGFPQAKVPLLGYKRFGPGKVLAAAARPFWSWGFVSLGFGEDNGYYDKMLEGTMSWLTVRDDFEPVRVSPEREVYNRGEVVAFKGLVFDQGYRPIPDVTGTVAIDNGRDVFERDLIETAPGQLRSEFSGVPPGRYRFRAMLEKEGRPLKEEKGEILVEEFSLEEFDRSGDQTLMMAVASVTGGEFAPFNEFDRVITAIDPKPVIETEQKEIVIWNKFWLLLIFILALAAEWVLRKIYNLI